MFLESFAKFLSDQYTEVLFSSVGDDEQIWIIATFRDERHFKKFNALITENPYIESFNCIMFNKILKGNKIFTFMGDMLEQEEDGEYFDDNAEAEPTPKTKEEQQQQNTSEVFF